MKKKIVLIYGETEGRDLSATTYELLTKGRELATALGGDLCLFLAGEGLSDELGQRAFPYGVDTLYLADAPHLRYYTTLAYAEALAGIIRKEMPQIVLFPSTDTGRDLAPRLAARFRTGLTAHCTALELADYTLPETGETKAQLLHQIRPALGGNIEATILTPHTLPQMASVMAGSFAARPLAADYAGRIVRLALAAESAEVQALLEGYAETPRQERNHLNEAKVIVCGGYGVGSKKNFGLLHELAQAMGGEVAATRAAVDAGWAERTVQIGQTGATVRPRLFIACGCSGALQFTSGMKESGTIVSINTDPDAPMNALADYVVRGRVEDVLPQMIHYYKEKK